MISSVEPTSSAATPTLLIRAISLTPSMLIVVVITTRIAPSSSAFCAPRLVRNVPGVGGAAEELEVRGDLRQHDLPVDGHGGDRHDRADDVDPAGHPRRVAAGDLLGPLVDRARYRILRGHLHEAQRDQDLAADDDRPRPPHAGTRVQVAEAEQRGDAGQDRDVAEPGRERGEAPQRPVELLLVTEAGKLAAVRGRFSRRLYGCHRSTSPVRASARLAQYESPAAHEAAPHTRENPLTLSQSGCYISVV